jgi:type IV pilus assembly protein PilB
MAETKTLPSYAKMMIADGLMPESMANELLAAAKAANMDFTTHLCSQKIVSPLDLALYNAKKMSLPYFDLDSFDLTSLDQIQTANIRIDPKFIKTLGLLPLSRKGSILSVATADPSNETGINDLKFALQCRGTNVVVVENDKLHALLDKYLQAKDISSLPTMGGLSESMGDLLSDVDTGDEAPAPTDDGTSEVDDAPVVKFLQKVLIDGINQGASDIHFEPYEKYYRIRFRQDGILDEYTQIPLAIKEKLASRIKVISKLDISIKQVPQDGRLKLKLNANRAIDFRVSSLPTLFGEKIVMRILDPSSAKLGIDALGYDAAQKEAILSAVKRPYGMVLVTGPTGSGKTVSLYTCLNILNEPGVNISTAEDPAEINLPGVNQVNVNDRAGLTFSVALKAFLRQDPDIIMVGEIRDLETADIAMKAALTGHLVLSTLHTNDAPATLTRLLDMGVKPFNIASAVHLITAQRLGRRLCKACKKAVKFEEDVMIEAGFRPDDLDGYGTTWMSYTPVGCDLCKKGYKGRVGIYQVMPVTEEMKEIILKHGTSMEIAKVSEKNGINDLRRSGLMKVKQGATSIEEVLAITNE